MSNSWCWSLSCLYEQIQFSLKTNGEKFFYYFYGVGYFDRTSNEWREVFLSFLWVWIFRPKSIDHLLELNRYWNRISFKFSNFPKAEQLANKWVKNLILKLKPEQFDIIIEAKIGLKFFNSYEFNKNHDTPKTVNENDDEPNPRHKVFFYYVLRRVCE